MGARNFSEAEEFRRTGIKLEPFSAIDYAGYAWVEFGYQFRSSAMATELVARGL